MGKPTYFATIKLVFKSKDGKIAKENHYTDVFNCPVQTLDAVLEKIEGRRRLNALPVKGRDAIEYDFKVKMFEFFEFNDTEIQPSNIDKQTWSVVKFTTLADIEQAQDKHVIKP